ncbi:protein-disulfide isomerase-like protein [Marine Group I thaumarchaeote SCGC RSA3]|uniref:Protein-disulfide isomerase-like protein n=3 Tax=Marine Group I TaxID=905826 RepID=A0A087RVG8_9ARCH|nr:putative disulfide bond formation protein D [Marine Group I thaumarchaeote SCGC AAA799-N04]KFM15906.1 putative disulfide bond formation protein D [Marine Group I thaumarchaeote SCGC AAA799-D11]KFM17472.1 protein-disulfide isomerase-like protein [Marine Group I thaumarchaeote SCGC RSA3]
MKLSKKIIIGAIIIAIIFLLHSLVSPEIDKNFTPENDSDTLSNNDFNSVPPSVSPVIGNPDAPVTIFAFNDYQCTSCKYWYDTNYSIIQENLIETNKANIVFLDVSPLGDDSILISQATFCADEQKKYSEYQEILYASQQEIDTWARSDQLKNFALELDLDIEQFSTCLDSEKYRQDIQSNIDYTNSLGAEKIPLFKIVNFKGEEHVFKGGISSVLFEEVVNRFQD